MVSPTSWHKPMSAGPRHPARHDDRAEPPAARRVGAGRHGLPPAAGRGRHPVVHRDPGPGHRTAGQAGVRPVLARHPGRQWRHPARDAPGCRPPGRGRQWPEHPVPATCWSGRSRCGPGSAASTSARACWCAARRLGGVSPFWDYDAAECVPWLAAAREAADVGWPAPVRTSVPVNVTVPAVGPAGRRGHRPRVGRLPHREGEGRRARPGRGRRPGAGRGGPRRARPGRPGPGRRQRRLGRRHRRPDDRGCSTGSGWSTSSSPAAPSRSWPRYAGGSTCRSPPTSRSAGPRTRCGWPGWRPPTSRCSRSQPLGGVAACLRIAEQIGLPVVVSSALETSVGIAAGLALAAALPELPYACGLATLALLDGDVTSATRSWSSTARSPWRAPSRTGRACRRRRNHGAPVAREAAGCAHRPPTEEHLQ